MEQNRKFLPTLSCLFPAFLTPFPRIFIIKGDVNNGRNPPFYPFLVIAFISEEATGSFNEESIGAVNEAIKAAIVVPRSPPPCFSFHVFLLVHLYT